MPPRIAAVLSVALLQLACSTDPTPMPAATELGGTYFVASPEAYDERVVLKLVPDGRYSMNRMPASTTPKAAPDITVDGKWSVVWSREWKSWLLTLSSEPYSALIRGTGPPFALEVTVGDPDAAGHSIVLKQIVD